LAAGRGRRTCGGLLLDADRPPQHPNEWEQWLKAVRKAIRRTAITAPDRPTDDTARQLIHTWVVA